MTSRKDGVSLLCVSILLVGVSDIISFKLELLKLYKFRDNFIHL
jgi:hypothetical protein